MKRIYIKPHTSIVQINLIGSVLEDFGVNVGSTKATTQMPSRSSTMTSSALMRKKQTTLILQQFGKTRNCCVSNLENTFHSPFTFRTFILIISKL